MKKYVAYTGRNTHILTVFADDESKARRRIRKQLNRPGRRGILKQWQEDGEKVRVEK